MRAAKLSADLGGERRLQEQRCRNLSMYNEGSQGYERSNDNFCYKLR